MMFVRTFRFALLASVAAFSAGPASAEDAPRFPSVLAGQAVLPATATATPPKDAPKGFELSGKFTAADRLRRLQPGSIPSIDFASDPKAPRRTGIDLPRAGQPIQGISAIEPIGSGAYYLLTDNGFGAKANSADALLMFHRVEPDFATGDMRLRETIFLRDPDRKVPFQIVNENTEARYLTGADFDPESLRVVGDDIYIGEEFGPYLLKLDRTGRILSVTETKIGDKLYRSPDHYAMSVPSAPGEVSFEVRRSGGFEPMGKSPDGKFLFPGLEKPIWDAAAKGFETHDGQSVTRIFEYSVAEGRYTGRFWFYPLSSPQNVVADLAMIDGTSGVLIERDDTTEGSKSQACSGEPKPDCFNRPAAFKRVVKIVFGEPGRLVKKVGYIDLTDIADPDHKAKLGARTDGRFELPHLGPEGVAVVDADHIAVVNDNNFPYSMGRTLGKPDDNELTLLRVPELLHAR